MKRREVPDDLEGLVFALARGRGLKLQDITRPGVDGKFALARGRGLKRVRWVPMRLRMRFALARGRGLKRCALRRY